MLNSKELGCFAGERGLAGTDRSDDRDSSVRELLASRNLLKSTGTQVEGEHLSFPWRRAIERVFNRGSSAKRGIGRFQGGRAPHGRRSPENDYDSGLDSCFRALVGHLIASQAALLRIFCSARRIRVPDASSAGHVGGSGDSIDSCLVPAFCNLHLQPIRPPKKIFQTVGHG